MGQSRLGIRAREGREQERGAGEEPETGSWLGEECGEGEGGGRGAPALGVARQSPGEVV